MNETRNAWAHRCIGELLEKRNEVQALCDTKVLYKGEAESLIEALEDAARCLGEFANNE